MEHDVVLVDDEYSNRVRGVVHVDPVLDVIEQHRHLHVEPDRADLDDFAGAVLRKLILEIAGAMPSPRLIPAAVGTALPCDVGEGLSLDYMDY